MGKRYYASEDSNDPEEEGRAARCSGIPRLANPYPVGSIERQMWFNGYDRR